MNTNSKNGVGYPSQAGTLAFKERRRPKLPSALDGSAALSYADIGLFSVSVFLLAVVFRIGVHLHVLRQTTLDNPNLLFQIAISLFLIGSLYAIVRLRHGRDVWSLLGWNRAARIHLVAALVGGIGVGLWIDIIARAQLSESSSTTPHSTRLNL